MVNGARTLRVAAVQMVSENGAVEKNLARATVLVEEAAARDARLVVLPEFMPTGYVYTKEIWDAAEPGEGPTVRWLRETSRRLGIWLGTSFLEAEGEEFFNSFVVTEPGGSVVGRVRKQTPAFAEAFYTRGEEGPHVVDAEWGRIGVGICYENLLAYTPHLMCSHAVDIMLMPHSAPSPMVNLFFPAKAVRAYNHNLENLASYYARMLGIPVVFVNKCGPWTSPVPGLPFLTQRSRFPGYTCIVDGDGTVKAQLGDEEGVIVEEVTLNPARRKETAPLHHGRWALKTPWAMNQFLLVEAVGRLFYRISRERRRRARQVSGRHGT